MRMVASQSNPWGGRRPDQGHDCDSYNTLEIETDADTAKGQSGGPLWGVFSGDRRVIGTLNGHEDMFAEPTSNVFAGGTGLVELVRWGRNNWG
jgi:hypothetical protein